MQFFIINEDPETNAKLLPDYAIKKVNVREGWQIISDIGHNLGIAWEGQNKPYSIWHAETRRFMVNRESFIHFIMCYKACLEKYYLEDWKLTVFHKRFMSLPISKIANMIPANRTHPEFMLDYMLRGKRQYLTDAEIKRLEEEKDV